MGPQSILAICAELPQKEFLKGEALLVENEPHNVLYVLVSGSVEVVKQGVQVNAVASPGSIFGEVSVLLGRRPMATVRTLEPSIFHVVDDAAGFLRQHPELNWHIARLLAHRLHSVTHYLVDLKQQFESEANHLHMVDEVLESLLHHQKNQEN
jgi:CRP-like cAMP-binding protein